MPSPTPAIDWVFLIPKHFEYTSLIAASARVTPPTRAQIDACTSRPNNTTAPIQCGRIAMVKAEPLAYVMYRVGAKRVTLNHLVVSSHVRRRGYASDAIEKVQEVCNYFRRREVVATVSEENLSAQLFLRANGFRIAKEEIEETPNGTLYTFRWLAAVLSEKGG